MNPKVSIVILNWNGWVDTIECLESLYQITYSNYEVIVVDNGSEDDSIEKIKEYAEGKIEVESSFFKYDPENKPIKWIEHEREEVEAGGDKEKEFEKIPPYRRLILIKNEKNYGFPEGCNIGMRYALSKGADYLLLLNNDTTVDSEFLTELVNVTKSDPMIGIAGSKIYYYYQPNKIQAAGGKIRWWLGDMNTYGEQEDVGQYNEIAERDYLYGTSLLIKKKVIEKISFIDPFFFFGVDDYDYCTRAKRAGFRVIYVPRSKIWHKAGASRAKLSQYPETLEVIKKTKGRRYYKYYYRFFRNHCPPILFIIPFLSFMLRISMLRSLFQLCLQGDWQTIIKHIRKRIFYIKKYIFLRKS